LAGGAVCAGRVVSVLDVIGILRFAWLVVTLVENRLGDDVLLRRPVTQVNQLAALAAKRKIGACGRVSQSLANRAPALHGKSILP
jgi:hypothetical protein